MWHGYIGIENLGLTDAQRNQLVAHLKTLGPASDPQPAHLCHWRTRLDNQAGIFEALFAEDTISIDAVKSTLGQIFSVDPATISHTVTSSAYGPVVTFARGGNKLRLIQFGGVGSAWMASGDACRAYLKANSAAWESAV